MKKILSLVLAVLMLASMAVSTSAVKILNSSGNGVIKTDRDDAVNFSDLLSIYEMFGLDLTLGGKIDYDDDSIYSWWYDDCPKCGGFSFHFVRHGVIYWQCLDSLCRKNGTFGDVIIGDIIGGIVDGSTDKLYSGKECTNCTSKKTIFLETVLNYAGEVRDRYYCTSCKEDFYLKHTAALPEIDTKPSSKIECPRHGCSRYAFFEDYIAYNGVLYARYICAANHVSDKKISSNIYWDYDEYTVRVTCTRGGYAEVLGGSTAHYGEKKTVSFTPSKGYVLTDVVVNGESVPVYADNTIEITVKKNTVIRAYFEKVSNLKTYDITTSVTGSGKITAQKNEATVSADKVSANYTDIVAYHFVPASKNYSVAKVTVNGKSVGNPSYYTVQKIDGNMNIAVTFQWNNPFCDLRAGYEKAVEYVTESGIMSASAKEKGKVYFSGGTKITNKDFAAALAEMSDTAGKLDTVSERIDWAEKYGVIDETITLNETCTIQSACAMVRYYLEALELINDISFVDLKYKDTIEETAIKIDLVTAKTYEKDRDMNRYDLAAVCYLLAGLAYTD